MLLGHGTGGSRRAPSPVRQWALNSANLWGRFGRGLSLELLNKRDHLRLPPVVCLVLIPSLKNSNITLTVSLFSKNKNDFLFKTHRYEGMEAEQKKSRIVQFFGIKNRSWSSKWPNAHSNCIQIQIVDLFWGRQFSKIIRKMAVMCIPLVPGNSSRIAYGKRCVPVIPVPFLSWWPRWGGQVCVLLCFIKPILGIVMYGPGDSSWASQGRRTYDPRSPTSQPHPVRP